MPDHLIAARIAGGSLAALEVRGFDVQSIALFVMRRRDEPFGPVAQALWSRLGA